MRAAVSGVLREMIEMQTSEVRALLRARYAAPEWAFLEEVANGTGGHGGRHCDALAMSLWPSRGLHLHGFEIKVSRSDWTRERKNPAKAEAIAKHCHFWWVVAPVGIVPASQIPPNWGLIEASEKGLKISKAATQLVPIDLTWPFFAAVMRSATEQSVDKALMTAEYERGKLESKKQYDAWKDSAEKRAEKNLERLQLEVDEFEAKAGIRINGYGAGRVAEKVKLLTRGEKAIEDMRQALERFSQAALTITAVLAEMETAQTTVQP